MKKIARKDCLLAIAAIFFETKEDNNNNNVVSSFLAHASRTHPYTEVNALLNG